MAFSLARGTGPRARRGRPMRILLRQLEKAAENRLGLMDFSCIIGLLGTNKHAREWNPQNIITTARPMITPILSKGTDDMREDMTMAEDIAAFDEDQDLDRDGTDLVDFFIKRDGVEFAGTHLLIDLWGATNLCDVEFIEQTLKQAALEAKATILHAHMHHFSPNGGVSGVVVLAESHISIHTWPERDFAALDVFMCGECNPYDAIAVLKAAFKPDSIHLNESRRGLTL